MIGSVRGAPTCGDTAVRGAAEGMREPEPRVTAGCWLSRLGQTVGVIVQDRSACFIAVRCQCPIELRASRSSCTAKSIPS